jgi:hypothetical protein
MSTQVPAFVVNGVGEVSGTSPHLRVVTMIRILYYTIHRTFSTHLSTIGRLSLFHPHDKYDISYIVL